MGQLANRAFLMSANRVALTGDRIWLTNILPFLRLKVSGSLSERQQAENMETFSLHQEARR